MPFTNDGSHGLKRVWVSENKELAHTLGFSHDILLNVICRKTTLLHVLSGHVPRHEFEGDVLLDGNKIDFIHTYKQTHMRVKNSLQHTQ